MTTPQFRYGFFFGLAAGVAIHVIIPLVASAQVGTTVPVRVDHNTLLVGPVSVPSGVILARVVFSGKDKKNELRKNEILSIALERSLNGGITYEPSGGAIFNSANQPATIGIFLPEPGNSARVIRMWFTRPDRWKGVASIELE